MILRLADSRSEVTFKPHPGTDIQLRVPSIHKAAALLGFEPNVGLEEGIKRSIAWYAANLAGVKA
jgi:nucleoside-diphosphate-sugar epimerase